MFSYVHLHMDTLVLADQQKLTFINTVQTLDPIKRTYQDPWPIRRERKGTLASFIYLDNILDIFDSLKEQQK